MNSQNGNSSSNSTGSSNSNDSISNDLFQDILDVIIRQDPSEIKSVACSFEFSVEQLKYAVRFNEEIQNPPHSQIENKKSIALEEHRIQTWSNNIMLLENYMKGATIPQHITNLRINMQKNIDDIKKSKIIIRKLEQENAQLTNNLKPVPNWFNDISALFNEKLEIRNCFDFDVLVYMIKKRYIKHINNIIDKYDFDKEQLRYAIELNAKIQREMKPYSIARVELLKSSIAQNNSTIERISKTIMNFNSFSVLNEFQIKSKSKLISDCDEKKRQIQQMQREITELELYYIKPNILNFICEKFGDEYVCGDLVQESMDSFNTLKQIW